MLSQTLIYYWQEIFLLSVWSQTVKPCFNNTIAVYELIRTIECVVNQFEYTMTWFCFCFVHSLARCYCCVCVCFSVYGGDGLKMDVQGHGVQKFLTMSRGGGISYVDGLGVILGRVLNTPLIWLNIYFHDITKIWGDPKLNKIRTNFSKHNNAKQLILPKTLQPIWKFL